VNSGRARDHGQAGRSLRGIDLGAKAGSTRETHSLQLPQGKTSSLLTCAAQASIDFNVRSASARTLRDSSVSSARWRSLAA
jgi:hypothetical protein